METLSLGPREAVKKALELGQGIVASQPVERCLAPPDLQRIEASLRQLEKAATEPARKLRGILELEWKAIEEGVKKHPATGALLHVAVHILPPAMITVISAWNHDSEALSMTLQGLRRRGYKVTIVKIS